MSYDLVSIGSTSPDTLLYVFASHYPVSFRPFVLYLEDNLHMVGIPTSRSTHASPAIPYTHAGRIARDIFVSLEA